MKFNTIFSIHNFVFISYQDLNTLIMLFLHEAYRVSSCLIVGLPRLILCAHLHFRPTQPKFIKRTLGSKKVSQPFISVRIFNPAIRRRLNFYSFFHLISRVSYLRLRVRLHEPRNESQTIFKFQIGLNGYLDLLICVAFT